MAETPAAAKRRIIGIVLLGSAFLFGVFAILCGLGVTGVAAESRTLIAVVLGAVALTDALIGVRFLLTSPQ